MSEEQDGSLSVHSPHYLHPSENPAISLVSPLLDPKNYNSWSRSALTVLSGKNKVEFVDDFLPQPISNRRLYAAWKRANNMVVSWLVHSIATSIRQSILWMDNAVDTSAIGNILSFVCNIHKSEAVTWILDSGATDHVASSLTCYSTYREINPIVVRQPTGQQVIATHSRTVKFTEFLHLEDVLYLPSFNFNLISISKLVSALNCNLTFFPNSCLI